MTAPLQKHSKNLFSDRQSHLCECHSLKIKTQAKRIMRLAIYIYLVIYMPRDTNAQNNANKIKTKCDKIELVLRGKKQEIIIQFHKTKHKIKYQQDTTTALGIEAEILSDQRSPKDWERIARPKGTPKKKRKKTIKTQLTMDPLGIASVVSAPLTAGINAITQDRQNSKNWKRQKEMFDMTNAYNAPIKQVERMKAANLNPALMYQGAPQNTASMSKAPEGKAYQIPENLMADIAQKLASAKLADSSADLAKATIPVRETEVDRNIQSTELSKQMAQKAVVEAERIQQQYNLDRELFKTNVEYRNSELQRLNTDVLKLKQELSTLPAETQAKIESLRAQATETYARTKNLKNQDWIFENQKELRELNINPEGGLIDTIMKYIIGGAIGAKKAYDEKPFKVH